MSEEKSRMERILENLERIAGEDAVLIPEEIITGESWLSIRREASVWDVVDNKIRDAEKILKNLVKDIEVPEEYRRYISRDKLSKLPVGTRVHRGPRGGLFVDVRELPERVRESIGEEQKEPHQPLEVQGKKYSGFIHGGVEYDISIDSSGEVGVVTLSKNDYRIKFEVGVKNGQFRVLEADIPQPNLDDVVLGILNIVSRRPVNIMADALYAAIKRGVKELSDKPHRILVNRTINAITLDKSNKAITGDDVGLGGHASMYPKLRSIKDDNFYRVGDSKIFVHESLDVDLVHARIKEYREIIDEENISGIFIVPTATLVHATDAKYNAAGFYDPQNDIVVLDYFYSDYAFLHEYFHGVYSIFERLSALDSIISNIRKMLHEELTKYGFKVGVLSNVKFEDEIAQKFVERVVSSFDDNHILAIVDHYLATSDKTIPEVVRQLKQVIDRYGGERALEAFRKVVKEFLKDDGATEYSYSYYLLGQLQDEGLFTSLTEAFSSYADLIEEVLKRMKKDKKFREMVTSKYGSDFHKWLNKELYNQVYSWSGATHKFRRLTKNREKQLEAVAQFLKLAKGVFKK